MAKYAVTEGQVNLSEVILVWRVSIPADAEAECLRAFNLPVERPLRRRSEDAESLRTSYFNVPVLERGTSTEAVAAALNFLSEHASAFAHLHSLGGTSELDFGIFVGLTTSFAPTIRLAHDLLIAAATAPVDLRVSSYPTQPCNSE